MVESTERLLFEDIGGTTDPEEVLLLVNSNPDWVAASDDFAGRTSWDLSDAEMHLWKESLRENSVAFLVRWAGSGELRYYEVADARPCEALYLLLTPVHNRRACSGIRNREPFIGREAESSNRIEGLSQLRHSALLGAADGGACAVASYSRF